jgi:hypothetical protein
VHNNHRCLSSVFFFYLLLWWILSACRYVRPSFPRLCSLGEASRSTGCNRITSALRCPSLPLDFSLLPPLPSHHSFPFICISVSSCGRNTLHLTPKTNRHTHKGNLLSPSPQRKRRRDASCATREAAITFGATYTDISPHRHTDTHTQTQVHQHACGVHEGAHLILLCMPHAHYPLWLFFVFCCASHDAALLCPSPTVCDPSRRCGARQGTAWGTTDRYARQLLQH